MASSNGKTSTVEGLSAFTDRILQSPTIKDAQAILPPKSTPAGSPNAKGTGLSSAGKEQKVEPPSRDEINIIPIFPMRFALTEDTLLSFIDGASPQPHPQSIDVHPNHELLRIRKGYFYIKDDKGYWHVFWYETFGEQDENASQIKVKTDVGLQPPYTFTKLTWENKADSEWYIKDDEKIYPYAFVKSDVRKCWVAYSEFRWPPEIFEIADRDSDFFEKLMVPVDLSSESGQYHKPLREISKITDSFKEEAIATQGDKDRYEVCNIIRKTATIVEPETFVLATPLAKEHGVLVSVYDPVGEVLDLNALINFLSESGLSYAEYYKYPLVMGNFIGQLQKEGALEEEYEESASSILWAKPLSIDYKNEYPKLLAGLDGLQQKLEHLLVCHSNMIGMDNKGSVISEMLPLSKQLGFDRKGRITEYMLITYGRVFYSAILCREGQEYAECRIDPTLKWTVKYKDKTDTGKIIEAVLKSTVSFLELSPDTTKSFVISLNEFMRAFGSAIAKHATRSGIVVANLSLRLTMRLVNGVYQVYQDIGAVQRYYFYMASGLMQRYGVPTRSDLLGRNYTRFPVPEIPTGQYIVNTVGVRQEILNLNRENVLSAEQDFLKNGIGFFAASYSLYSTLKKYDDPNYSTTHLGYFANDPRTKITTAFMEGVSAAFPETSLTSNFLTQSVSNRILSFSPALARTARSGSEIIRNGLGRAAPTTLAKLVSWVGISLAVAEIWEGVSNKDIAEASAGALSLVGAVIFFAGVLIAWPLAILGALAIVGGVVISFFKDTDYEKWAKEGFWGTSYEFLNFTRATSFIEKIEQLDESKYLDRENSENKAYKEIYESGFNNEIKRLMHMMYKPKIVNSNFGDGQIEIIYHPDSNLAGQPFTLRISARKGSMQTRSRTIGSVSYSIVSETSSGYVLRLNDLDKYAGNWLSISLEMDRYPNGKFKDNLKISTSNI
ncbi:hypothetical protein Q4498_13705 [Neptunomonas phycophila]|uniref:toxin VasX n=1 Tax=Neptunomonas phycophila TaxID=1572645 RepID=UPI0026E1E34A|nr:toxin VasX [Neptunomonas phycophila]MDO6469164.1 hypothetical protein [Neptunomonas phycophila]